MKQLRLFSAFVALMLVAAMATAQTTTTTATTRLQPIKAKSGAVVNTVKEYKVISYNVRLSMAADADGENRWENRKAASLKMVAEQKPIVMGLQEACPDQIEYLDQNLTGYKHIGVGRDDGDREGEMMAIYYDTTRLMLLKSGTFWLSETPDKVSRGWDAACNRTCTWGFFKIKNSNQGFFYFNTHLDHMGREARKNSIELIVSKIAEINPNGAPVLLSADFNSPTDNAIFDPLKAVLHDARTKCKVTDTSVTYNGFGKIEGNPATNNDNEQVIDHIFYRGVTPVKFQVLNGDYGVPYISDHYPIAFTFRTGVAKSGRVRLYDGNTPQKKPVASGVVTQKIGCSQAKSCPKKNGTVQSCTKVGCTEKKTEEKIKK
ncbi:MAG: endonuclease/exonuclease/phosphatase family protein [Muribaculaceae bacterium]